MFLPSKLQMFPAKPGGIHSPSRGALPSQSSVVQFFLPSPEGARLPGPQSIPGLSTALAHSGCVFVGYVNQVHPDFRLAQPCSLSLLG